MIAQAGYRESDPGRAEPPREGPFFRFLTRIENVVMAAFLLAALAIGAAQIVLRYVFNTGFVWSEGAVVVLTIWGSLFGASQAITRGLHVRIEFIADNLSEPWRRAADVLANVTSAAYVGVLCWCGVLYVQFLNRINAISIDLELSEWLIYLIVPISMALFLIRYLREILMAWKGRAGRADTVLYD